MVFMAHAARWARKQAMRVAVQTLVVLALSGCSNQAKTTLANNTMPPPKATPDQIQTERAEKKDNLGAKKKGELPRVLVFTKTKGYRHKNIPEGVLALREIGVENFVVQQTEDSGAFTTENLNRFSAIIFFSTTGDVLNKEQQSAFEQYIHLGGGFVGIHAAADTEYDWPWYGQLVGAWFRDHTKVILATVLREDKTHISTVEFPDTLRREDEWYRFKTNPRKNVHVLMNVDDQDLGEFTMNGDHPISWMHEFEGGRTWYTAMGHTKETFLEPEFRKHVLGGIMWAMGDVGKSKRSETLIQPEVKANIQLENK